MRSEVIFLWVAKQHGVHDSYLCQVAVFHFSHYKKKNKSRWQLSFGQKGWRCTLLLFLYSGVCFSEETVLGKVSLQE